MQKKKKLYSVQFVCHLNKSTRKHILHLEIPSGSSSNSGHCRRMCHEYSRWKIPWTKIHLQLFTCQIQILTAGNGAHTHTHLIFSAMGRAKHHHLQLLQWKKTEGSALHLQRNSGDYMTPTQKIQYYGQISQNDHWTIHLYCLTPCWFPQYRYFNDPPNKWTWFTLKKMNPVTGQKTPQRQTAGTWKDPSIESNGTWYVINDKWQVI